MGEVFLQISAIPIAYLIGSIPFGFLLTKIFKKQNIQQVGSGNIGATNVMRVAGKKLGIVTFCLDGLKGVLAVYVCFNFFTIEGVLLKNLVIISTVLGHIYPVWLKFKGGKGVATLIVIVSYTSPMMCLMMVVSWCIFYKMFYIVSLASVVAMVSVFAYQISFHDDYLISSVILASLVIYKHFANIKRLLAGEETSFKQE
ncbi:MAG: glycerol-3-phosphate 1-O-acyltransferase PlsY [Rickettsiales bacterium]|jgi:acyl phosphate:glycerol-3-phosphate acyltransferase|nr:glycerol-3-phosphate 1-O-acyltransferase PlsY [Rickettsiales bacterium]